MSILGVQLLCFGIIRDYFAFGICRLVMYSLLSVSYLLIALSVPGESDKLQYLWITQMGGSIGLFLNSMQFLNFFPKQETDYTGKIISGLTLDYLNESMPF